MGGVFCDLVSGLERIERSRQCSLIYTPRGIMGYLLLCKLHALFPVVKIVQYFHYLQYT